MPRQGFANSFELGLLSAFRQGATVVGLPVDSL